MYKIIKILSFKNEKIVIMYRIPVDFSVVIWYADSVGACPWTGLRLLINPKSDISEGGGVRGGTVRVTLRVQKNWKIQLQKVGFS